MDITEFERRVQPSAKRSRLERFRSGIFELKRKGYADAQIRDWLAENGLVVSRQAVQQFARKGEVPPKDIIPSFPSSNDENLNLRKIDDASKTAASVRVETIAEAARTVTAETNSQLAPAPSAIQSNRTSRASPATTAEDAGVSSTLVGEFGLLGIPNSSRSSGSTGFIDLESRGDPAQIQDSPIPSGKSKKRLEPMQNGVPQLKRRDSVPAHVYEPGELEHPAIPGLMLTLEHRLYGAALEYSDIDGPGAGKIEMETPDQKRFRVVWRHTIPATPTRTAGSFTKMDMSLFPDKPHTS